MVGKYRPKNPHSVQSCLASVIKTEAPLLAHGIRQVDCDQQTFIYIPLLPSPVAQSVALRA